MVVYWSTGTILLSHLGHDGWNVKRKLSRELFGVVKDVARTRPITARLYGECNSVIEWHIGTDNHSWCWGCHSYPPWWVLYHRSPEWPVIGQCLPITGLDVSKAWKLTSWSLVFSQATWITICWTIIIKQPAHKSTANQSLKYNAEVLVSPFYATLNFYSTTLSQSTCVGGHDLTYTLYTSISFISNGNKQH